MIEAIGDIERETGKPAVSSNQATIWACLRKLGIEYSDARLGRLFH
jgi:maleate cis-trans isomerase